MYISLKKKKDDIGLLYISMDATVTRFLLKLTGLLCCLVLNPEKHEFGVKQLLGPGQQGCDRTGVKPRKSHLCRHCHCSPVGRTLLVQVTALDAGRGSRTQAPLTCTQLLTLLCFALGQTRKLWELHGAHSFRWLLTGCI